MAGRGSPAAFPQTEEVSADRRKRLMQASSTDSSSPPPALVLPLMLSASGLPVESRSALGFLRKEVRRRGGGGSGSSGAVRKVEGD